MTVSTIVSPIKIGDHTLDHRVVLAPLTRLRNTMEGVPQEHCVEYYQQRASQGGLLISEATIVSESGHGYHYAPGLYTKEQTESWKKVTEAVHAKGAIMFSQLWHVGRATSTKILPNNRQPIAPSPIAIKGKNLFGDDFEVPHAVTLDEIKELIQDFVNAAKNAVDAGFDGVEIMAANGYLIDQFINSSSNSRDDQYGGSIENRARFALDIVDAVVEAIGVKKTAIRFSPWSEFQDMKDDTPIETWSYLTQQLQDRYPDLAYIHYIEARESGHFDGEIEHPESLDTFRAIWKGPFVTAGGFIDPKKAIQFCEDHPNNLIAFGRIFIANPDLPERIRNNLPLNKYHRPTFYTQGLDGYIDYPFYDSSNFDENGNQIEKKEEEKEVEKKEEEKEVEKKEEEEKVVEQLEVKESENNEQEKEQETTTAVEATATTTTTSEVINENTSEKKEEINEKQDKALKASKRKTRVFKEKCLIQ